MPTITGITVTDTRCETGMMDVGLVSEPEQKFYQTTGKIWDYQWKRKDIHIKKKESEKREKTIVPYDEGRHIYIDGMESTSDGTVSGWVRGLSADGWHRVNFRTVAGCDIPAGTLVSRDSEGNVAPATVERHTETTDRRNGWVDAVSLADPGTTFMYGQPRLSLNHINGTLYTTRGERIGELRDVSIVVSGSSTQCNALLTITNTAVGCSVLVSDGRLGYELSGYGYDFEGTAFVTQYDIEDIHGGRVIRIRLEGDGCVARRDRPHHGNRMSFAYADFAFEDETTTNR